MWPQGPVVRGRRHDILNVTVEPSGQRTGCEDDLTAWLNSGRCPSLESLDPRAGADKTLTPGLHCIVPAAPTPVISGHVGQQTIKSPTEVSGPPTLGGSGYPRYVHTCRPTYPGAGPEVTTAQEGQSLPLPHPYLLPLVRGPLSEVPCPPASPHTGWRSTRQSRVVQRADWGEFSRWPLSPCVRNPRPWGLGNSGTGI